jgi:hypothetical protein
MHAACMPVDNWPEATWRGFHAVRLRAMREALWKGCQCAAGMQEATAVIN